AFEDTPNAHLSHDLNFIVSLDLNYQHFHSDANPDVNGNPTTDNSRRVMEMEWETKFLPTDFWPVPGDRFWTMGRWIFDCGHTDGGYRTEFHPPVAVAFTRLQPTTFAGDTTPSLTNQSHIFISGRG